MPSNTLETAMMRDTAATSRRATFVMYIVRYVVISAPKNATPMFPRPYPVRSTQSFLSDIFEFIRKSPFIGKSILVDRQPYIH